MRAGSRIQLARLRPIPRIEPREVQPVSPGNPTDAIALADKAKAHRRLYNEIRPRESLDFATLQSAYLAGPEESHPFRPESVQES